jgi:hypothetical protein
VHFDILSIQPQRKIANPLIKEFEEKFYDFLQAHSDSSLK